MEAQLTRKWHQKKRFILPALVFFPPLGIPLIWLSPWSRNAKIGATIVSGLLMMGALADSPQTATQSASNSAPVASSRADIQPSRQKSGTSYQEITKSSVSPDANAEADTEATLIDDDPKSKINLRAAPSGTGKYLGYGLVGDHVQVISQTVADEATWYQVKFPRSGALGWIRGDFVRVAGGQPASSTRSESQATSSVTSPSQSPNPISTDDCNIKDLGNLAGAHALEVKTQTGNQYWLMATNEAQQRIISSNGTGDSGLSYEEFIDTGLTLESFKAIGDFASVYGVEQVRFWRISEAEAQKSQTWFSGVSCH